MTIDELEREFENSDWSAQSALIEFNGDRGIVLLSSHVRRGDYASERFVVFWEDGEVSACPSKAFELIKMNLWR